MDWFSGFSPLLAQVIEVADAAKTVAKPEITQLSMGMQLLIVLGVLAGSFLIGHLLARALRLPDFSVRIGFVLFTLLAGIAVCVLGWPPKLGIDLSGGVVLVYEVDRQQLESQGLEQAVGQAQRALGSLKQQPLVRTTSKGQLEIVLSDKKTAAEVRELVEQSSTPQVKLVAAGQHTQDDKQVLTFNVDQQFKPIEMDKLIAAINKRINPSGVLELTVRQYGKDQVEVIIPEVDERQVDLIKKKISTAGLLEFRILANQATDQHVIALARQSQGRLVYEAGKVVARWVKLGRSESVRPGDVTRESPSRGTEVLVLMDPFNVTGSDLAYATGAPDETGHMAVHFKMDSAGGLKFGQLTGNNLPDKATGLERQLGIVLDDELLSAPAIKSKIQTDGQITGNFTDEDVNFLVGVLNAGRLPAALSPEPIREQKISAQLGEDTVRQGRNSMIASTLAVLAFMLVYYRFAGIVADVAVIMNLILAVALMILIKAAFTLPGLAGLVLTVGIAVDANVLIYERMREEAARGASFRMTIRNGFTRAMSTIIDSNTTTVISAVVLYKVGTDQVKGFAVTLILGLVVSLYTAIFVARLVFDIVERKRWITHLKMLQLIGETHLDFVRWRTPAITASCIVIGIGLAAAAVRGKGLLDIDFSGGSSVEFKLKADKPYDMQEVREKLSDLPDLAVSGVGTGTGGKRTEFQVDTSEPEIIKVQQKLQEVFGTDLATYSMTFGEIEPWNPNEAPASGKAAPEAPAGKKAAAVKPAPEKPAPEKPANPAAAQPAAGKTPAAEKPAAPAAEKSEATPTSPPADKPAPGAEGTKETKDNKSALLRRAIAPAVVALAMWAGDAPSAAADQPAADKPAAAAGDKATGEKTESAATAPAEKPAAEKPAAEPATPAAEGAKPAAEKPAAEKRAEPSSQPPASDLQPANEGTKASLTFAEPITYDALSPMIEHWLSEHNLAAARFELLNPERKVNTREAYSQWIIEITLPKDKCQELLAGIQKQLGETPVFPSSNAIGGKVAGDTQLYAIYALLASMVMIVIYVWIRFQNVMFGLAAVLATFHDVLVAIGFLALSKYLAPFLGWAMVDDFKISLAVVAALLTIVGYSINDTIVIFDRIREIRGKNPDLTESMINSSVNQCLGRTILTAGTVFIGTFILYFFGGQGIHPFAYAMLIGLFSGTYSTVYIAAPMLLLLKRADNTQTVGKATPAMASGGKGRT